MYIYVGFSKSKKKLPIGSWLIRAYQLTEYSHTYIRIKSSKFPSDHIIHASEGKVIKMSKTQFDKRHTTVKEFKINIPNIVIYNKHVKKHTSLFRYILDTIHELSGDDYSLLQNVGIVLVRLLRMFGIKIKNPWRKGWNCSEFVAAILLILYPSKLNNISLDTITPKDIYLKLEEINKVYLVKP